MRTYSFENLYVTRFVAAVGVVLFHFYDKSAFMFEFIWNRLGEAVNYFFFLSGFVMVIAYRHIIDEKSMSFKQVLTFYSKRFARIYPLYLFAFVLSVLVQYMYFGKLVLNKFEFLLELVGLQRLFFYWSINFPAWTISVEFVFYILFPFIFPFLCRLPVTKMCVYVLLCYTSSMVFNVIWGGMLIDGAPVGGTMESVKLAIFNHPFLKVAIFLFGNCCGLFFLQYAKSAIWLQYLTLPISFLVFYLLWLFPEDSLWVQSGILCPLYFLLVWSLCVQNNKMSKVFGNRFCIFLGNISYGVYILQVPIFVLFKKIFAYDVQTLPQKEFMLYLSLLIAVSTLLYYVYEKPMKSFVLHRSKHLLRL